MGGAAAIYTVCYGAKLLTFDCLILESTFTTMPDVLMHFGNKRLFPGGGHLAQLLNSNVWPSIERIKDIEIPIL